LKKEKFLEIADSCRMLSFWSLKLIKMTHIGDTGVATAAAEKNDENEAIKVSREKVVLTRADCCFK